MELKIKKWPIIICASVFVVLTVLASIFDLQLSKWVVQLNESRYFSDNFFGVFFEVIGSFPVYFAFAFAIMAIGFNILKLLGKKSAVLFAFILFIGFIALYLGVADCGKDYADHSKFYKEIDLAYEFLINFSGALIFTGVIVSILLLVSDDTLKRLLLFAIVIIVACGFAQVTVAVLKSFAGRARYRAIWFLNDETLYTPWYEFSGSRVSDSIYLEALGVQEDAFRSFPSGHTASAGAVYVLLALPHIFKKTNTKKWKIILAKIILTVATVLFTGVVAVARILVGAHFFSDVLFGGTIAYVSVYGAMWLIKFLINYFDIKILAYDEPLPLNNKLT